MSDASVAAQAKADAAWADHSTARDPMRAELLTTFVALEGVTGLQAGPGSERLADAVLDFAEYHTDELVAAHAARTAALAAQDERDQAIAAEPVAEPPTPPSMLESADANDVREWLKEANDVDVLAALNNVTDRGAQVEWANKMMAWARQDGNIGPVFAAINTVLVPPNPAEIPDGGATGGVGGTSSYGGQIPASASADDEPTDRTAASDRVPNGDAAAIVDWVNHGADATADLGRARQAFAEEQSGQARPEVLTALVDIIDAATHPPTDGEKEAAHAEQAAADLAALPLYEYVGPDGTAFDPTEWVLADVQTTESKPLYRHPSTDTPGAKPLELPADSLWAVYAGETIPAAPVA